MSIHCFCKYLFLFSELDALRSSDSHCSAEEEHTEGLPGGLGRDGSPVSSSYSELGRGQQQQQAGLTGAQLHQLQQGGSCTLYRVYRLNQDFTVFPSLASLVMEVSTSRCCHPREGF